MFNLLHKPVNSLRAGRDKGIRDVAHDIYSLVILMRVFFFQLYIP